MKKVLFLAALALISAVSCAQKKNVSLAKSRALAEENPDFVGARAAIKAALDDETTKNLPETWYVAGLVDFQECNAMRQAGYLGQQVDQMAKGQTIASCYDYWMKALELAQQPISIDKKGKEKFDTKTPKNIAQRLAEAFKNSDFCEYGIACYGEQNYAGAYDAFAKHVSIPNLACIDDKLRAAMPKDTLYEQIEYYAALAAIQAEMHHEAIALLKDLTKNGSYETAACYEYLYQEYVALQDTAAYVAVLEEAIAKFPTTITFVQLMINHYIYSNQIDAAITYLEKAISADPTNAQYYNVKGNLNASQNKFDAAIADYNAAIALDANLADAYAGIGRVYFNQARIKNEAADGLRGAEYKKVLDEMDELCRKALPPLEKAHELNPEEKDYIRLLSMLYGRFESESKEYSAKYKEMMSLLGY